MKQKIFTIKRYDLVKNGNDFYVKDYDRRSRKEYLLKAKTWEEAKVEAIELKEKLKIVYKNKYIIVID